MVIGRTGLLGVITLAGTALLAAGGGEALAWGATGHFMISQLAAQAFPDELPAFLRTAEIPYEMGELGRELDRSKGQGQTHDFERDPGHYIDFNDDGTTLGGGLKLADLPVSRRDFDTAVRAAGQTQYSVGYLPYSLVDGWQQVRADFAYIRALAAGEKYAKDASTAARFARDRMLRELITIRDIGVWSHYVADATMPLHVSVHFDGWGDFPNPNNYPNVRGLHAKFEGTFVRAVIKPADVVAKVPAPRDCGCDIWDRVKAYLQADLDTVVPMYKLEMDHAFDGPNPAGQAFVTGRLAAAVGEIRDLVVMAWRDSENHQIGYPAVKIRDIENGTDPTDALDGLD